MERAFLRSWIAALLFVAIVGSVAEAGGRNTTVTPIAVLHKILMNYDKSATPGELTGEATVINVGLYLMRLQIDEQAKTASSVVYFRQTWLDKRLKFSQLNMESKLFVLHVTDWDRVWLPDTYFFNQVAPVTVDNRLLKINPNGSVWYVQRLYLTVPLKLDHKKSAKGFVIPFKIGSFGRSIESIVIKPMSQAVDVDPDFISPTLINEITVADCTQVFTTAIALSTRFRVKVTGYPLCMRDGEEGAEKMRAQEEFNGY